MTIMQNRPVFGVDTDNAPAIGYRIPTDNAARFAREMERRGIAPDATITQDDGRIVACYFWDSDIVAYRHGIGIWDACVVYRNTVRPHMIPADLDLWVLEQFTDPSEKEAWEHATENMCENMIRTERIKAGLTQTQLAEKIGVTQNEVSRWETGERNPKLDKLKKIADALNVPITELI